MVETDNTTEVLEVASIAGHILLENGAEISRVEDTMERIASHYGVDSGHFFVLSNGNSQPARSGSTPMSSSFPSVEFSSRK